MAKKIQKQITSGWVDESISMEAMKLLLKTPIKHDEFIADFKILIGRYRLDKNFKDTQPMPKETIDHLDKIIRQIEQLRENIDLIPSDAHAWNLEALVEMYGNLDEAAYLTDRKISNLLSKYSILLDYSKHKIENHANQKGRTPDWQKNKLIFETYKLFNKYKVEKTTKENTYEFLSQFLIKNGVSVPIESDNIGKIINKILNLFKSVQK